MGKAGKDWGLSWMFNVWTAHLQTFMSSHCSAAGCFSWLNRYGCLQVLPMHTKVEVGLHSGSHREKLIQVVVRGGPFNNFLMLSHQYLPQLLLFSLYF